MKLSTEAEQLFKKLTKEWNIRDTAGRFVLTRALEAFDEMKHAQDVLAREGEVVLDRWGQRKLHPMCQKLKEARAHLLQCLKSLSLDLDSLSEE